MDKEPTFKVFISNSVLEDVIFQAEDDYNPSYVALYKILKCHNTGIYVSEEFPKDNTSVINLFCSSYGNIPKVDRCRYVSEISSSPSTVLKEPSSVFLLDIEPSVAKDIQNHYGVICLSKEDAYKAGLMLMDDNKEYSPDSKKKFYEGWDTVLYDISQLPSNSLIINDRYLFSNKEKWKGDGFKNLNQILQLLLPTSFAEKKTKLSYHVMIVFDPTELCEGHTFRSVALELVRMIENMREYTIKLEVLGITKEMKKDGIHFRMHNRRIISNYYIVKTEHQIAAFNDIVGTCSQTITPQRFFTEDSLIKETSSTSPQRSIRQLIEVLEDFDPNDLYDKDGFKAYFYLTSSNGDTKEGCQSLANRLIKKKKTKKQNF